MRHEELLELAWVLIANASGGNWTKESPEWQQAAARWRNEYHRPIADAEEWYRTRLKDLNRNPG